MDGPETVFTATREPWRRFVTDRNLATSGAEAGGTSFRTADDGGGPFARPSNSIPAAVWLINVSLCHRDFGSLLRPLLLRRKRRAFCPRQASTGIGLVNPRKNGTPLTRCLVISFITVLDRISRACAQENHIPKESNTKFQPLISASSWDLTLGLLASPSWRTFEKEFNQHGYYSFTFNLFFTSFWWMLQSRRREWIKDRTCLLFQ